MNQRYTMFRRAGIFYYEDTSTGKQLSLRTKDEAEAKTLLNAKNESFRQPILNLQIAKAYLIGSDIHVVVGTRGVFLIETKARRRRGSCSGEAAHDVIYSGEALQFPTYRDAKPIEQAKRNAKWLANYLTKKTPRAGASRTSSRYGKLPGAFWCPESGI